MGKTIKNLTVANQLIQQIAAEDQRITPITPDDFNLFQHFFTQEPHTYGNSWTYVTQGLYGIGKNNLGYKFYDGKNLSAVCVYPKIENPNIYVFYWIRPMGKTIINIISNFAQSLLIKNLLPTYTKKIFKNQHDLLLKNGFSDVKFFPWHSACPSEDDTYPEQIYDVKYTLNLLEKPPRTSNIRKSYRKSKLIEKNHHVKIHQKNFNANAWKLTQDFFNSDYIQTKKINVSSKFDYYNPIFNNPIRSSLEKKVVYIDNVPLGYYIAEKQNEDYSSIYALIILRDKIQYLSDFLIFNCLENCKTNYLNIGGSEESGIHKFKLKFKPTKEVKTYWATNYRV